jgi:hypothetical protein
MRTSLCVGVVLLCYLCLARPVWAQTQEEIDLAYRYYLAAEDVLARGIDGTDINRVPEVIEIAQHYGLDGAWETSPPEAQDLVTWYSGDLSDGGEELLRIDPFGLGVTAPRSLSCMERDLRAEQAGRITRALYLIKNGWAIGASVAFVFGGPARAIWAFGAVIVATNAMADRARFIEQDLANSACWS